MSPTPRFDGWRIVAAAFAVAVFGWGTGFYGPPVYLETVRRLRGWPVDLVSGAVTLHFLAGVAVVAGLPRLHRRFGLPAVTLAGAVVLALGILGWSLARTPWQLYGATLLSGAGWPALGAAAVNAIVSPWFVARRPAALATAYNGASVGGVIFSPLWVWLIGAVGFPVAALLIGTAMVLCVGALAGTLLRRTPEAVGQHPDGALTPPAVAAPPAGPAPAPWRDRRFVTLALGMALALFAQIGLLAQLVSLLAPALGVQGAGLAAGLATAAAILGRLLVGWCMPARADRRAVAALSLLVQAAGSVVLALAGGTAGLLVGGVILIGLGIGNATSLPPLIAQAEFRREAVGRIVALIVAGSQAAYAFAPAVFGLIRGLGPDAGICVAAAVLQVAAAGVYVAGRRGSAGSMAAATLRTR
ncbi:MFS transporter [Methylobacterium sp. JK268]